MNRLIQALVVLSVLLLLGCRGPVEGLTGNYEAQGGEGQTQLSLRSDGGGALLVGAEEAPFRWEAQGNGLIILHTRQGGIISAQRGNGTLELDMPGVGKLLFRKTSN